MYIIIESPNSSVPEIETDSHGFIMEFYSYEEAKEFAEKYYTHYKIYLEVSDLP